jgi:hypothetical protein
VKPISVIDFEFFKGQFADIGHLSIELEVCSDLIRGFSRNGSNLDLDFHLD